MGKGATLSSKIFSYFLCQAEMVVLTLQAFLLGPHSAARTGMCLCKVAQILRSGFVEINLLQLRNALQVAADEIIVTFPGGVLHAPSLTETTSRIRSTP